MTEPPRTILLLSGGVDSALCGRIATGHGADLTCLFVDYGQAAARAELAAAGKIAAHLEAPLVTRTIGGSAHRGAGEHRGRNALLVSIAAVEAGVDPTDIIIGIHSGTGYYDCSPRFVEVMNTLLAEQSDGTVRLSAPLLDWSKSEVLEAFATSGLELDWTYSCEGADEPCEKCRSCLDRAAR